MSKDAILMMFLCNPSYCGLWYQ